MTGLRGLGEEARLSTGIARRRSRAGFLLAGTVLTVGLLGLSVGRASADDGFVVCKLTGGPSVYLALDDDCDNEGLLPGAMDFGPESSMNIGPVHLATGVDDASIFDKEVYFNDDLYFNGTLHIQPGSGGSVNMGGGRIQNVGAPTAGSDAATKAYVDGLVGGGSARDDEQDDRLDGHDAVLASHTSTLNQHDTRLTNVELKNQQQDGRLDAHDATLAGHGARITQTETKNVQQDGRLDNHETRITQTEGKNVEQDDRLDQHQTTLDIHTLQIAGLDSRVTTNTQDIAALDSRVTGLEGGLADLGKEVSANRREARGGTALALAAAGLRYDDRPEKLSIAGGIGHFKGYTGLSFGVGYATSNSFRLNAAVSGVPQNGDVGFSAGLSWTLN
jgi:hypothetical protein